MRLACVAKAAGWCEVVGIVGHAHTTPAEHVAAARGAIRLAAEARQGAVVCMK